MQTKVYSLAKTNISPFHHRRQHKKHSSCLYIGQGNYPKKKPFGFDVTIANNDDDDIELNAFFCDVLFFTFIRLQDNPVALDVLLLELPENI